MSSRDTDARPATLVDIPLVRRLTERGVVLDSELGFTREPNGPNGAIFSSILLPQRGLYTLIARSDKQQVVGQFRLRPDDQNAHIVYIAPGLDFDDVDDTAWLQILDAMTREAGKHGAHSLIGEVNESSVLFETMRTSGFAVYARQEIWLRHPGDYAPSEKQVDLTEQTEADLPGIQSLLMHTVPSLVQQIAMPSGDMRRLVYRKNDRIEAYIAISEGKHGIYIIPYLHPSISGDAAVILETAIKLCNRPSRLPVCICVRRHQDWITGTLAGIGFDAGPRQAVMVRHITAGVRYATFPPIEQELKVTVKPPTRPLRQSVLDPIIMSGEVQE